jgi:hypothetical protein
MLTTGRPVPRDKREVRKKAAKTAAGMRRQQRLERQLKALERPEPLPPRKFGDGHREKGVKNYTSRMTQEAILEGLSLCGGRDGLVGFVVKAVRKDIRNGVTMLNMITPRMIDAHITRTDVTYKTIADLDQELSRQGLPPSSQIFALDYKGTAALDDDEVVALDDATDTKE